MNKKKLLFIVLSLGIAFGISQLSSGTVFIAHSPKINPSFISQVFNKISNYSQFAKNPTQPTQTPSSTPSNILSESKTNQLLTTIDKLGFKKIQTGVYAAEQNNIVYYKVVEGEVDWDQIILTTKSGNKVVLRYPKGQPPMKELITIIESK